MRPSLTHLVRSGAGWLRRAPSTKIMHQKMLCASLHTSLFSRPALRKAAPLMHKSFFVRNEHLKAENAQDANVELVTSVHRVAPTSQDRANIVDEDAKLARKSDATVVMRQRPRQKARNAQVEISERSPREDFLNARSQLSFAPRPCVAYCTAESYNFDKLLHTLQKNHFPSLFFSEVIHVSIPPNSYNRDHTDERKEGDVFYFKDGCVVFWDVPQSEILRILEELASFENGPYDPKVVYDSYSEELDFTYGKHAGLTPLGELVVTTENHNGSKSQILEKIAFSYGVQRSVKMTVIENIADDLIVSLKHIPDILMDKRPLKMDQKGVMKKMGQLLAVRSLINLQLPLSETPEAYWEEPWLEELYSKISRELDLVNRVRTLNRKLDYAQQVVEVLRTDLSEKHSTRLEQIIIGLISLEVLFEIVHFVA